MIDLSGKHEETALGRSEAMFSMYRLRIQIIIVALDACLQSNEIDCVDSRVFSVTMLESFVKGFCLTNNRESNFEEIVDHVGSLVANGIVKHNAHILDFEPPRDEIVTLCGNARDEIKKHFSGDIELFDKWLGIFVEKYQQIKKCKDEINQRSTNYTM